MSKALDIAATLREALADMEANGNPAREARIGVVALEAILSELERLGRKEAAASLRFFDIDYRVEGCGRERLMAIADFDLSTDTAAAALVVAEERECYADDVEIVDVQERDPRPMISVKARTVIHEGEEKP